MMDSTSYGKKCGVDIDDFQILKNCAMTPWSKLNLYIACHIIYFDHETALKHFGNSYIYSSP